VYESKSSPLLPSHLFKRRLLAHLAFAFVIMLVTLMVGVLAHIFLEAAQWHDAILNTALIVGGIGPYLLPESTAGKIFFAAYGMFVGLVFITMLGIVLAPLAHRLLHKFHLDEDPEG